MAVNFATGVKGGLEVKKIAIILLVSACFALSGCGSSSSSSSSGTTYDTPSTPSAPTVSIAGIFNVTSLTNAAGTTSTCPGTSSWTGGSETCGSADQITFNANSTLTEKLTSATGATLSTQAGTYYILGNTVVVTWTATGEQDYFTATWNGTSQTAPSTLSLVVSSVLPGAVASTLQLVSTYQVGETVLLTYTGSAANVKKA